MPQPHPQAPLAHALYAYRGVFVAVAVFSFVTNLLMLAPSVYMLQVYDRVISSGNTTTLLMLSVILLGVLGFEALLEWIRGRALVRANTALELEWGPQLFDAHFQQRLAGQPGAAGGSPFSDLNQVRQFLTGRGLFAVIDAPFLPVYLAVIFMLHPLLGWFAVVAVLVLVVLAWLNEKLTAPLIDKATLSGRQASRYVGAHFQHAETLRAMGMLGALRQRWAGFQTQMLAEQAQASDQAAHIAAFTRFARLATQSGVLGLGALLVIDKAVTPGAMIAASILLGRALAPVDQLIGVWRTIVSARQAWARLNTLLLDHPPQPATTPLPPPLGELSVEGLVVRPPGGGDPILKGLQFKLPAHTLLAVAGHSASGKSTLAKTLVGAWSPQAGVVRLDGADLRHWPPDDLGKHLGYVPQDVELFEGTVAQNIARLGVPDSAKTIQAAQLAGVHDLILSLPQGYDTPLAPGSGRLSGGQRQRIALARALYGNPALVVLDEPDASLDDAGIRSLADALQRIKAVCTVVLVTHRRVLINQADQLMFLEGGHIRLMGPRNDVLARLQEAEAAARHQPQGTSPSPA